MHLAWLLSLLIVVQVLTPSSRPSLLDDDAYDVYNVMIPREWTVRATKARSLVIVNSTAKPPAACFPSGEGVEGEWTEVAEDFRRMNVASWALAKRLSPGRPHVSATREDVMAFFTGKSEHDGWHDFHTKHPESVGFIEVSAVGFNRAHTKAIVYVSHSCGGECGGGAFHFLERAEGAWRRVKLKGDDCDWKA